MIQVVFGSKSTCEKKVALTKNLKVASTCFRRVNSDSTPISASKDTRRSQSNHLLDFHITYSSSLFHEFKNLRIMLTKSLVSDDSIIV